MPEVVEQQLSAFETFLDKLDKYFASGLIGSLITIVILFAVAFVLKKIISRILSRLVARGKLDATAVRFAMRIIWALLLIVAAYGAVMQIKPLQSMVTAMVAGSSLVVLIVGFASQEAVANIVSGMFITMFRPFGIGDYIRLPDKNIDGTVEDINLRHTVIRTFENSRIILPNSVVNGAVLENCDFGDHRICTFFEVSIAYSADIDRARAVMTEVITSHPAFLDNRTEQERAAGAPPLTIRVSSLGDYAVTLRTGIWCADRPSSYGLIGDVREGVKRRFDEEGIEIPFPTSNVYLRKTD